MVNKENGLAKATPGPDSPAGKRSGRKTAPSGAIDRRALRTIRAQLVGQQEELLSQLEEIEQASFTGAQPDMSGEVSFDEDSVDAGSFTAEREKDLSIAENVRDLLGKITKALHKIDNRTYGICESCGKPIEAARLKALPHVLLCLSCKKAEERR